MGDGDGEGQIFFHFDSKIFKIENPFISLFAAHKEKPDGTLQRPLADTEKTIQNFAAGNFTWLA